MNTENNIKQLKELQEKMHAYNQAMALLYVDSVTVAPSDTSYGRGITMGVLAEESHKLFADERVGNLLNELLEDKANLDFNTAKQAELLKEDYDKIVKIPVEEYVEYTKLLNESSSVWHSAKENNDYASFEPLLKQIIVFNRKIAAYYDDKKPAYDVLLNEYEKNITTATYDVFFKDVRDKVAPLVAEVSKSNVKIDDGFLNEFYPKEKQRILSEYLMKLMTVDLSHCTIGETEHPFTDTMNKYDVRITTNYDEHNVISSMYSVIHESGHALYELNVGDDIAFTCASTGTSMGIHESQSRFYENIIGRSKEFISYIYPKLTELFPEQLKGVSPEKFYLAANKSQPSLIRTEADELTYSLHIMIRYEIEKLLISGELTTKELPMYWNKMYKEYLGIDVPDDKRGVLQDSHWGQGSFGYFPSYALGSAYGAQMLDSLCKDVDVWGDLEGGNFTNTVNWFTDKIYKYGKLLDPDEVIKNCCGTGFEPKYYTEYLSKKFTEIYKL